jgi:hypothetical protein
LTAEPNITRIAVEVFIRLSSSPMNAFGVMEVGVVVVVVVAVVVVVEDDVEVVLLDVGGAVGWVLRDWLANSCGGQCSFQPATPNPPTTSSTIIAAMTMRRLRPLGGGAKAPGAAGR